MKFVHTNVVVTFRRHSINICSRCNKTAPLYKISAVVAGVVRTRRISSIRCCRKCLLDMFEDAGVQMTIAVSMKDMISDKDSRRVINKKSKKREEMCAKEVRGRRSPASGSGIVKGDVQTDQWLIEDKYTEKMSYSLRLAIVKKTLAQAMTVGKRGVIKLGLAGMNLAIIMWEDFLEMMHEAKDN